MSEEKGSEKGLVFRILRRVFFLVVPILVYVFLLGVFWFVYPPEAGAFTLPPSTEYLALLGLMGAYLVPPFGKETIIPLALGLGYPIWVIFLGVVGMDIVTATFVSLNFDLLLKVPLIGRWIRWVMRTADKVRKSRPWIEQLSSAGLLLFMYIPLQGSGSITCSVLGRLLGYKPAVSLGLVIIGSVLSTLTVAIGASSVIQLWYIHPLLGVAAAVIILVVILAIAYFWSRFTKKFYPVEAK
ncbi:MAG TPA: small multi-drug export protein [Methanocorpusculum sp.]|nr:small multi-drug export protein [Methanocorpusculum sp.]HJJ50151.1 small multi-drug export protein [Methanocorpusculum sp.]